MKIKSLFASRCQTAAQGLLLGLAVLVAGSASAQNFVKNPDFEEEFGPDNWSVEYAAVLRGGIYGGNVIAANAPTNSGPLDFLVKGRTCLSHRNLGVTVTPPAGTWDGGTAGDAYWNKHGAHFMPNHTWVCHAYFKQVVTGLQSGSNYDCSAWMTQFGNIGKANVYLEALGATTNRTQDVVEDARNNPAAWKKYTVTCPATNGQIEIRLHFNKNYTVTSSAWSYREINAFYDHVAVVPAGQTNYMPPFAVVSVARTNQDLTLIWETVENNRYRIQYATNVSDPMTWYFVNRGPGLDTNYFATGPNFTFKTNVAAMFAFEPNFDPNGPLFFRIHSTSFVP